MLNLDGILTSDKIYDIAEYTDLRFDDKSKFKTPEALALYEQRYLSKEQLKKVCEEVYGFELFEPVISYIPQEIVNYFEKSGVVPVSYEPMSKVINVVYLPEIEFMSMEYPEHEIHRYPTTIYYYLEVYQRFYGCHECLRIIPAKTLFDFVVKEAIDLGAIDMTIVSSGKRAEVYYNVLKQRFNSHYLFDDTFVSDLIKLLTIKSPPLPESRKPKKVDVDLNKDYRGRVQINRTFSGYMITIRLVKNKAFDSSIYDLGMTKESADNLRKVILNAEKGLRIIAGETASGKNTTALSLLRELVCKGKYKVVSVEIPVEHHLIGVEQINCDTVEEYIDSIQSLIWVNPDFIYITEIQDATGLVTMQVANTGKRVLSTIHANSVADVISRLMDITKLDLDRVIQSLHSIVYQELIYDEETETVFPRDRYVRFTDELKYSMYGKSLGEVMKLIKDNEEGDVWTYTQHIQL